MVSNGRMRQGTSIHRARTLTLTSTTITQPDPSSHGLHYRNELTLQKSEARVACRQEFFRSRMIQWPIHTHGEQLGPSNFLFSLLWFTTILFIVCIEMIKVVGLQRIFHIHYSDGSYSRARRTPAIDSTAFESMLVLPPPSSPVAFPLPCVLSYGLHPRCPQL
ncbi:hypothetical protein GGR57DRAFT_438336 [Xylariaceae sp. FL1272]|nr:hypothetical protein GGR57DRAFT_438336 [Xylariaceae sp. FL1272]